MYSEYFVNQTVMEVGAGLGICGLVAGAFAKEVHLTDYNTTVLETVERNVQLNLLMDQSGNSLILFCPSLSLTCMYTKEVLLIYHDWLKKQRLSLVVLH